MNTRSVLSFSEKKVSRNAVITFALGIIEIIGYILLILWSITSRGNVSVMGGLAGCLIIVVAFFGTLWGVLSYDDVKTNQRFKIPGICLNLIAIFMGIILVMF
ncbi:MAG: hypothetical protein LUF92_08240 [Clostridiales bacterium]|nr:hypothetical protein [Clostridiales bacterium]